MSISALRPGSQRPLYKTKQPSNRSSRDTFRVYADRCMAKLWDLQELLAARTDSCQN
jgi:hypothetical protein